MRLHVKFTNHSLLRQFDKHVLSNRHELADILLKMKEIPAEFEEAFKNPEDFFA